MFNDFLKQFVLFYTLQYFRPIIIVNLMHKILLNLVIDSSRFVVISHGFMNILTIIVYITE